MNSKRCNDGAYGSWNEYNEYWKYLEEQFKKTLEIIEELKNDSR